ncbi:MAG: VOC family protein [Pseudomonadota bacterium]
MTNAQGSFIWYELLTSDLPAARAFYQAVIGWHIDAEPAGDIDYRMISAPDGNVGGAMQLTPEMRDAGARSVWLGYLYVDDVDAMASAVAADGGGVRVPPTDIPGVGRFAMVTDPQGATFYMMHPTPPQGQPDAVSTVFQPGVPGHFGWNELSTNDTGAALAFYGRHFHMTPGMAMPMGEMGVYQIVQHGGTDIGAIMPRNPDGPPPTWLFYIQVADIDAATATARELGAQVLHGPVEVPGGSWIIVAVDPQGATFALVGPRGEAAHGE